LIERPLSCRPARSQNCHIGANARPTAVRQARIHRPPDPRRGLEEALRDAVATKSDIAKVKHVIQLAVRDMTIRKGAIVVALLAAMATINFFA
jgi:hypothetical protein